MNSQRINSTTLVSILASLSIPALLTFSFSQASAAAQDLQKVYLEKLSNNAPIEIVEDITSPRQSFILVFQGGAGLVPKEQQGITTVLSQMLGEGPKSMTGDAYRKQLFLLNSSISVSGSPRAMYVSVTAPVDNLKKVLSLAFEVIQNPKLDPETFSIAHGKVQTSANSILDNMRGATYYFAFRDAFKFHPDVLDGSAAPGTIKSLSLETAKEWYPKLMDFQKMAVATVGPATKWKVLADAQNFMAQTKKVVKKNTYIPTEFKGINPADYTPAEIAVALINKPKATDNQILYIFPESLQFDSKERLVSLVTHENLGGGLTGMLGDVLRTQRGLTYHASTRADGQRPYWTVYTFGGIFQTQGLLAGVPEVIEKFKAQKIEAKDVELSKQMNRTFFRSGMELPEDRLFSRLRLKMYGLNPGFIDQFEDLLGKVTPEEVDQFRKAKLNTQKGFLYLMGDKSQILPVLEKAGFKKDKVRVIELTELI